ncbi:hypothetical protein CO051_05765 [Candidatus Roizmanbacteria bacterium CG_4_9_14_0_2_um_filter_39_13]|uniref:Uncharacterized protein n=2 Tax=Candidatus Roizmaniibacteriota TaxID=1752723 RepID=A0A2M8EX39_9BACT|nr:MAG: hypothetical protein COY15_04770 [Candidatus Roizmanbacteria bacterium CG_4_10_14_0_2_um_filter_39_12]PJC30431.1 MAG: hypothetical protein CO051_05765 [Candidatus Roizmanbacteria bacterium CG_4_9_14_0_2_um_filter_39_13]PJE61652.1 MAG: hypothetical protein COU87_03380 [Candidatus Roizmanbacteria bacterium CG10_big_fil_rev_8_21_14_0_10_39_12]
MHIIQTLLSRILFPKSIKARWVKHVNYVPKRIRIIAMTLVMLLVLAIATFFPFNTSWMYFVPILIVFAYLTTYIAIFDGIDGIELFMLFIMPVLFVLALYVFYSLLPVRWLTRIPFLALFSLGYYAMLLSANIFNIGVEKSIQLYRAAFSVNYISQTLIIFISAIVILSFRLNFIVTSFFLGGVMFVASLQCLWTVNLNERIEGELLKYSAASSLILIELMILLSFVPLEINVYALIVTTTYYSVLGIVTNYVGNRLFKTVAREYIFVLIFVCVIGLMTLQW